MLTIAIIIASALLYILVYRTYGRYLARRIFRIDPERATPAHTRSDGVDFVPSRPALVFGHHFTSIAGTGPIVGPAIAVVWGWVPALVWVLVGSIFMGAVHDFGSLIVSMRHQGRTIADLAGDVVNPRVRLLFMLVCLVGLWIVLAVFGLVIATIFSLYPSSVAPVWLQIPIAIALGVWIKRSANLVLGTLIAVALMYGTIVLSATIDWSAHPILPSALTEIASPIVIWTLVLMVYVFIASILPVHILLQPRDFINAWQLIVAMGLLMLGLLVTHPPIVADPVVLAPAPSPNGAAPSMLPFLFITVACGAVSGFHCLVASGCASRQLSSESHAQRVGFGAMLTEGFLAVLVILACVAGFGLASTHGQGRAAFDTFYTAWGGDSGLASILTPFVVGAANAMQGIGVPHHTGVAIMGVFIASFAATTLDSATRLQRYLLTETLQTTSTNPVLRAPASRVGATLIACASALLLALSDVPSKGLAHAGLGGLTLWPVFGATNQLLASLALLVVTVWLVRHKRPVWVTAIPMGVMLVITGSALLIMARGFLDRRNTLLLAVSVLMSIAQIWIAIEALLLVRSLRRSTPPKETPSPV
jgi:carbon starvation protein